MRENNSFVCSIVKKAFALIWVLSCALLTTQAQSGFYKLQFGAENGEAWVSECPKPMSGKVEVPEQARVSGQDYTVTKIGVLLYAPFKNCRGVTEVVLPASIKSICRESFMNCVRLKKINLPSSLKELGYAAFQGCENLDSIAVPQGISEIKFKMFSGCKNLKYASLPFTVKEIGDDAFGDCAKLKDFNLPPFLISISQRAFQNCSALESLTLPATLSKIGARAFSGCSGLTEIMIPANVSYVWDGAFSRCENLKRVDLKDCSFGGGNLMFEGCERLESVENFNLKEVAQKMFKDCKSLKDVIFGANVRWISPNAFGGTSIEALNVPAAIGGGLDYADQYVGWSALKSIEVDPANKKYSSEDGVLYSKDKTNLLRFPVGKELDEFVLPASVKQISDYAFAGCKGLKKLVLPKGFSAFSDNSFSDCPNLTIEMK